MYFPCPKCIDNRSKHRARSLSVRKTGDVYSVKCFHSDSCVWNSPVILNQEEIDSLDLEVTAEDVEIEAVPITDELVPPNTSMDTYYSYRDREGHRMLLIHRRDSPEGKKIFPMYSVGACLEYGLPPGLFLFGSQGLIDSPSAPVLVVEGEKAALAANHALRSAGVDIVVVTWPLGCSNVLKGDWGLLKGREVILWPDNDEAGKAAMKLIERILSA